MKGTRSTCLLCRHIARSSQWKVRVTQFSTTAASKSDDPTTKPRTFDEHFSAEAVVGKPNRNKVRRVVPNERKTNPDIKWSQNGQNGPRKTSAKDSARVDALFEQIVHEQTTKEDEDAAIKAKQKYDMDMALINAIGRLEQMINRDDSVGDAFVYLKTTIYPMLRQPDITIPKVFNRVVSNLLEKLVAAKSDAIRSPKLPPVAQIFRVYTDIGEMKPQQWAMVVGKLVQSILKIDPSTELQEFASADENLTSRDAMLADLVNSWKILSLPKIALARPDNEVIDDFWFPRLDKFSLAQFSAKGDFPAALASVFPFWPPKKLGPPVAVLAVATYALLLDPQRSNEEVRQSATRFIMNVAYLITFVDFRAETLLRMTSNAFPGLENYVMVQWRVIKKRLKEEANMFSTRIQPNKSPSAHSEGIDASSLGPLLGRAYIIGDIGEVDRLWQMFVGSNKNIPPERAAELRKYPDLFDSFINIRMALNRPNEAIISLNTLRQVGLRPTLKTWNVLLDGCKKAGNLNGLKNVWTKIAGSGMKLDTKLWTTRVSGLIECGDAQGGIQAMEEMASLWNKSSKDKNATVIKPTIEPVNAALVGLIRQNHVSAAEKLLVWASKHGIEPDIYTFNILLRRFTHDGRDEDVRRLFKLMRDTGVQADVATFTIIIEASFPKLTFNGTEEDAKKVTSVLENMQAARLEPNLRTYGKMIHNLLQLGDRATDVVKAILAHLWGKGLELSPHIYTMLVEHYFSQYPPDLDGVESLLHRRRLLDYDDMDATFYHLVIKGYLRIGMADKAFEAYHRLAKATGIVPMATQVELLRALLKKDRVDDARDLVATTKRMFEESPRAAGEVEKPGFWDQPFWRLAWHHGLFPWDGKMNTPVPNAEDSSASELDIDEK